MSRGAKKRKQLVGTCIKSGNRVWVTFVHNANNMLAPFKEKFKKKYCNVCRSRQELKFKEEKHSS